MSKHLSQYAAVVGSTSINTSPTVSTSMSVGVSSPEIMTSGSGESKGTVGSSKLNSTTWMIVGYNGASKSNISILAEGSGGINECLNALPRDQTVFGGIRLGQELVKFYFVDEGTSVVTKGRASMHKNGTWVYVHVQFSYERDVRTYFNRLQHLYHNFCSFSF